MHENIHSMSSFSNDSCMPEEGVEIWKKHFAHKPENTENTFTVKILVSWFNFIIHLLMTLDKFGWTLHMLKSTLWELLTANDIPEHSVIFHIPNKCLVSQAPVCLATAAAQDKENVESLPNQADCNTPCFKLQ